MGLLTLNSKEINLIQRHFEKENNLKYVLKTIKLTSFSIYEYTWMVCSSFTITANNNGDAPTQSSVE